jgi:hypothetical protein
LRIERFSAHFWRIIAFIDKRRTEMNLSAARRILNGLRATAEQRPLTKAERQKFVNVRANIRRLTGNHFAA